MSSKLRCACIGLLCISSFLAKISLASPATEPSLEDLLNLEVESASRYAQPLTETPSNVTVISAEDIRRFGFRDLAEALQMAPGIHITRDRAYSYLGIRGFSQPGDYNTRILLLQDGGRINDPLYDQANIGNELPLHLDWVKRVEFVAGASSANYGGNALFGIANTILWSGADIAGTRVNLSAGNGHFGEVSLLSGGVSESGVDWLVGLASARQRGEDIYFREFDQPGISNGVARNLDSERYTKGLFKFSQGGWRGAFNFLTRDKEIPTAYYGTDFNTQGNFVQDQIAHFDLTHNTSLNQHWNQQVRLHAGHLKFNAEYPLLTSSGTLNRDESRANWLDFEYSLLYSGLKEHRILLGTQLGHGYRLSQANFDILPAFTQHLDDRRSMFRSGIFFQDEWLFNPRWHLNWGLRLDQQTDQPSMTSPRMALIHRHNDALTLKTSLSRAYRYANLYERFYQDGGVTQNPSPNLKPEQIDSREFTVDYLVNANLRVSLGHYQYQMSNLITLLPDPADASLLLFQNQDRMRAKGWESQLEAMLSGGWRLRLGFNWQYARQSGAQLVNSPTHLGKLLLDGPLPWGNWTLGINLQGVGDRRSTLGHAPGFVTGNVILRQKQQRGGAWSFALYNLSGKRYLDTGSSEHTQALLPSNGREWRVRWEYGF